MWTVLTIIAVLLLIFFSKRRAAWGGLTFGLLVGAFFIVYYTLLGRAMHWSIIHKCAVLGVFFGVVCYLAGQWTDKDSNSP
jgi:hypothetical protein